MFSIVIPSWNNLHYLKLCVESLRKYSNVQHEIIIHVNDGSDGTLDWVRSHNLLYTHSRDNIGICVAVNSLAAMAKYDWLVYVNDDMVFCPGWDTALVNATETISTNLAVFSSALIEPRDSANKDVIVRDFGSTPSDFNEAKLIQECGLISTTDRDGAASQPTLVHRKLWHLVGGYSLEFSPGFSSDDDFLMKCWLLGCRDFRIVGKSKVYHFGQRSTARVRNQRGGRTFVMKWGITQQQFRADYLAKSAVKKGIPTPTILGTMKRLAYASGGYPLGDLATWNPVQDRTWWKETE